MIFKKLADDKYCWVARNWNSDPNGPSETDNLIDWVTEGILINTDGKWNFKPMDKADIGSCAPDNWKLKK